MEPYPGSFLLRLDAGSIFIKRFPESLLFIRFRVFCLLTDKEPRTYQKNRKWGIIYILTLMLACLELWLSCRAGSITIVQSVAMGMSAMYHFTVYIIS